MKLKLTDYIDIFLKALKKNHFDIKYKSNTFYIDTECDTPEYREILEEAYDKIIKIDNNTSEIFFKDNRLQFQVSSKFKKLFLNYIDNIFDNAKYIYQVKFINSDTDNCGNIFYINIETYEFDTEKEATFFASQFSEDQIVSINKKKKIKF